jgi:copper chaperone NosL
MKSLLVTLALAAAWAAACATRADGPPALVVDRTACSHCRMLVSEPRFAAATRSPGGDDRIYDDVGCLLAAERAQRTAGARFWFHDASTGGWIDGDAAVFVAAPAVRTPMGGGILAFATRVAAEQAAAQHGGELVGSLDALLARTGALR